MLRINLEQLVMNLEASLPGLGASKEELENALVYHDACYKSYLQSIKQGTEPRWQKMYIDPTIKRCESRRKLILESLEIWS